MASLLRLTAYEYPCQRRAVSDCGMLRVRRQGQESRNCQVHWISIIMTSEVRRRRGPHLHDGPNYTVSVSEIPAFSSAVTGVSRTKP